MTGTQADSPAAQPECPVCGAELHPKARACPACGADENTGWNEDSTRCDGLDLPAPAFDDGRTENPLRRTTHPVWVIIALGLAALFTFFALIGH
jgi:predicted amidophosphoribosyltransferase